MEKGPLSAADALQKQANAAKGQPDQGELQAAADQAAAVGFGRQAQVGQKESPIQKGVTGTAGEAAGLEQQAIAAKGQSDEDVLMEAARQAQVAAEKELIGRK
jgi:hypothetical protein